MSLEFQAFSWTVDDGVTHEEDYDNMDFTVHIFGKTREGLSVGCHVKGYHPYFCVQFDEEVSSIEYYDILSEFIQKQLRKWEVNEVDGKDEWTMTADYGDHLLEPDTDEEKISHAVSMWGFTNKEQLPFFKFSFQSMA